MPTYDYECSACNYSFDKFQTMTADILKDCPECKKPSLKRLIGKGMGIIFKGTGFYTTDYKKATKKEEPKTMNNAGTNNKEKTKNKESKTEVNKAK